jgi:peptidoglycan hydrolase-like protein with peptidoglycan-binding domain
MVSMRKSKKQKRGNNMTDTAPERYDSENDQSGVIITPDVEVEGGAVPLLGAQEEVVEETQPTPPEVQRGGDKPAFPGRAFLGMEESRSDVISSGEAVAFVNQRFGIAGDQFTEQTQEAVKEFQRSKGLSVRSRVGPTLYNIL